MSEIQENEHETEVIQIENSIENAETEEELDNILSNIENYIEKYKMIEFLFIINENVTHFKDKINVKRKELRLYEFC